MSLYALLALPCRPGARPGGRSAWIGTAGAMWLAATAPALAFPLNDQTLTRPVPTGSDLAAPDAQDLRNQLQIVGGISGTGGGGWTVKPRIDIGTLFTDNALQVSSPRQADVAAILSPGISVLGDTARLQMRFEFSPVLTMYARTSSQNSLANVMAGTALATLVPNFAFIDMRVAAGVQPRNGGYGNTGLASNAFQTTAIAPGTTTSLGLARDNQVQTTTLSVSPYILQEFGDYGTLRAGVSAQMSRYATQGGFGVVPSAAIGNTAQNQLTTEQTLRFVSGQFLGRFQDTVDIDLTQTSTSAAKTTTGTTVGSTYSPRTTISNKLSYAVNRLLTVFGSLGYENIQYSGGVSQKISGLTWSVGSTWYPNPDSQVTLSYGLQQGATSFAANANYQITARTNLTASYSNQVGTQLQNLQRQLDSASLGTGGSLVNSETGAPLLIGNQGLGVQPGLFRFNLLSLGAQVTLDRDLISLNGYWSEQTSLGSGVTSPASTAKTLSAQWTHELRPDLSLITFLSYTLQSTTGLTSGDSTMISAGATLQYQMTESLTGRLRYSYFERHTPAGAFPTTALNQLNFTQNLVIVGISKQF